jgi:hypothetical protein
MTVARVERLNLETAIIFRRLHNLNFGHGDV